MTNFNNQKNINYNISFSLIKEKLWGGDVI